MKYLSLLTLCFCLGLSSYAQDNDEQMVKDVIDALFDGMRANDSTVIAPLFVKGTQLSSIYRNKAGEVAKSNTEVSAFITAVGMPRDEVWNEVIWSYDIKIDAPMANAWTEYTFYRGDKMSHCGVNVFELIKIDGAWRISGLTDTRRTSGCNSVSDRAVNQLMDNWHNAASTADEDVFFGSMAPDAIYIGTDPTERWTKAEFEAWSKQYFEREAAWSFKPTSRNVSFDQNEQIGWFDELLDSWMGTIRGSGVVVKTAAGWKIKHYHLSIAVPNDVTNDYLKLIGKEAPKRGE